MRDKSCCELDDITTKTGYSQIINKLTKYFTKVFQAAIEMFFSCKQLHQIYSLDKITYNIAKISTELDNTFWPLKTYWSIISKFFKKRKI